MGYQLHDPSYSGTADDASSEQLSQEDFDSDDLAMIGDHYLLSESGFPPESFTDLALPVVNTDGSLSRARLSSAKAGVGQLDGVSDEIAENTNGKIDNLVESEFLEADFE
jgi:hypothetical protein